MRTTRENHQLLESPVSKTIEWKGGEGIFIYYDKESESKVEVNQFALLLLCEMSSISGYSEDYAGGVWSNEVDNTKTEEMTVRHKAGIIIKGIYSDIKKSLPKGASFTKAAYFFGSVNGQSPELVRVLFTGSSFGGREKKPSEDGNKAVDLLPTDSSGGWLEFCKKHKRFDVAVKYSGQKLPGKNASVNFFSPVLEAGKIEERHEKMALENTKIINAYLDAKKEQKEEVIEKFLPEEHHVGTDSAVEDVELLDDNLPF